MAMMLVANRGVRSALAAAVPCILFLGVYLTAVGRGFLKDDFGWIAGARVESWHDVLGLFTTNVGFYRPLVSLTFAADHALWGLNPVGYGMTNLALALAGAAALYALVRRLALPRHAALLAASVWALNFHAVNMALLWLSGRTALLLVLFALATAHAMLRGRHLLAGVCCLCALLSKEEAVALPLLWTVYTDLTTRGPGTGSLPIRLGRTWPLWAALGLYAVLREQSGAFSAANAPSYYQFSFAPALVARNAAEYADRAGTTAAIAILVLLAATGWRRLRFEPAERRAALLAALWIPASYALTLFLPVRSSLYALLPSIGAALLAAVAASSAARARPEHVRRATAALLVLVLLLAPVYLARNRRWTEAADLSSAVMTIVQKAVTARPGGGHVALLEDPDARFTADVVFSGQFPVAVTLFSDGTWTGSVVAPGETFPPGSLVIALRGEQPIVLD